MKYNYILYSVILSALFFFNNSSNADSLVLDLPNGTTWTGEVGQTVHVKYKNKNEIAKVNGSLVKVTETFIFVDNDLIFIDDIVLIQNSETTTDESPPTAAPPNESSSEDSKDEKDNEGSDWVVVRGEGITSDEAKQDAWRNAIEQVAGVYITANSLIKNGKLVKDIITSHSNAFIEEFQLLDEDIEDGVVRVRINARVATKSMFEKLQSAGGELKFRSVDGESKYAKIVTQKQQTKNAIEMMHAAMEGYPEKLIDIKIGKERLPEKGIFDDGKEHLIVPLTFSWNNGAWNQFSNNLNQYLKSFSSDNQSFTLHLKGLKTEKDNSHRGTVAKNYTDKKSWLQCGWERAWLENGELPWLGRFSFDYKLKGIYDCNDVWLDVWNKYKHDAIFDVVVILDNNFKKGTLYAGSRNTWKGTSYAVTKDIWNSILHRMKQTPAFHLNAISKDGDVIGQPESESQFDYSVFRETTRDDGWVVSLPSASGLNHPHDLPNSVTDIEEFDKSDEVRNPRIILIAPFFTADFDEDYFNFNHQFYLSEFSYEYTINLTEGDVKNLRNLEVDTYVLDLHNKRRRENGSQ